MTDEEMELEIESLNIRLSIANKKLRVVDEAIENIFKITTDFKEPAGRYLLLVEREVRYAFNRMNEIDNETSKETVQQSND